VAWYASAAVNEKKTGQSKQENGEDEGDGRPRGLKWWQPTVPRRVVYSIAIMVRGG